MTDTVEMVAGVDPAFRAIFESALDAMVLADDDGRYIDVNEAACELYGRTRDDMLTLTVMDVAEDPERSRLGWASFLRTGQARGEVRIVRPDGTHRWADGASRANIVPGQHLAILRDVTPQREAAEDRRRSEEIYAKTFRASPVPMAIASHEGRIVDVNEAAAVLAARSRDELLGRTGHELNLWPPQHRAVLIETMRTKQSLRDYEAQLNRPSGEKRDVILAAQPMELGGQACMLMALSDVTERRAAERGLAEAESLGRVGTWSLTFETGELNWSPEARRIFELPDGKILFNDFASRIHPDDRERVTSNAKTVTDEFTHQYRIVRTDGTVGWIQSNGRVEPDASGKRVRLAGMLLDITDQRKAKARLAASERRYYRMLEISSHGVATLDIAGTITYANKKLTELLGLPLGQLLGTKLQALAVPADRDKLDPERWRKQAFAGISATYEIAFPRADSEPALAELSSTPLTDESGFVDGTIVMITDVTQQKRLQTSLRETEQQLQHLQRVEAIGSLAGGIAHDFNNFLTVISASALMIEDSLNPHDPIIEDARAIRDVADRATMLTRKLLAFSRRQVLEPRVVNVEAVVTGLEKVLRRLIGERISLVTSANSTGNALVDVSQFEQVIMNLAVNARDAMPAGGELAIDCENVDVDEALAAAHGGRSGPHVRVTVSDTGTGMDEATRGHIFEPFFTTKPVGKGTGLGLATVFGIIRQSEGFIEVKTVVGKGSSFALYLPRTDRERTSNEAPTVASSATGKGETILVVEDEELVRKLVQRVLRREGYEVLTAASAGEALLICEQQPDIDVLLTDVVMPIMNGRQLAERLRALYPTMKIAFMSGYNDDDPLRAMIGTNEFVYMQKPIPRDVLVRRIRDLIDA